MGGLEIGSSRDTIPGGANAPVQDESTPAVGPGAAGGTGPAPDSNDPASPGNISITVVMSLVNFKPPGEVDTAIVVAMIALELKHIQEETNSNKIKIDQEAVRSVLAIKKGQLEQAGEKIEAALAKEENASIWDKIKMGFEALGAALMVGLGAALLAIPGFQVAGAMMIAGGVMSLIMVADTMTKELSESGMGIAGNLALLNGESEEAARDFDLGFTIGVAVVGLAMSVGSGIAGFKAAAKTIEAVQTLAKAWQQVVGKALQSVATATDSAINVVTATADIVAGVKRYDAADLRADSNELRADAKEKEAVIESINSSIDIAMAAMMASSNRFAEILEDILLSVKDTGNTLSQARFTG